MKNGAPALTVVCKATFLLQPGLAELARDQDDPNEDDTYWDDDPRKSLSLATDLVPYKARADVLVVGHTFAPNKKAARSWVARISVGPLHKAVEVYTDRAFGLDGELREGPPITRARLGYERAAGGPDSSNPIGMRFDVVGPLGTTAIPNLQPSGVLVARRGDTFGPIGFGPIAPGWPGRRNKLHGPAASFGGRGWNVHPLPEGVESAYFNMAPPDQQTDALPADERITLECLHPEHSRLVTRLPGIEPLASVERHGHSSYSLPLVCDTLWIDTDRCVCQLVWRATVPLAHPSEAGRITVDRRRELHLPLDPAALIADAEAGSTLMAPLVGAAALTLPFQRQGEGQRPSRAPVRDGALPFGQPGEPPAPPQPGPRFAAPDGEGQETVFLFDGAPLVASPPAALPVPPPPPPGVPAPFMPVAGPAPVAPAPAVPAAPLESGPPIPAGVPAPVAPPLVVTPAIPPPVLSAAAPPAVVSAPPEGIGPPIGGGAWSAADEKPAKRGGSIGERMAQELAQAESRALQEKKQTGEPEHLGPLAKGGRSGAESEKDPAGANRGGAPGGGWADEKGKSDAAAGSPAEAANVDEKSAKRGWKPMTPKRSSAPVTDLAKGGALAASNAAAPAQPERSAAPRAAPGAAPALPPLRDAIELLWLDLACLPRVRRQPAWKDLLAQIKPRPLDDEPGADAPPDKKQEARDRREMAVLLSRGETVDQRGIEASMSAAVNEDGIFVPPLVLVGGELTLPFDEVETLKATLAAVTPLVAGDVKLQAAIDTAQKLLQTPWLNGGASELADNLTVKIREAFAQQTRAVPARYLDHHTERILLHQRAYQKRTVLGKTCVRGVLVLAGTKEGKDGLPVYLPEEAARELPGLLRFSVKLMAEGRQRLEEAEERGIALRVVGVGRVMKARAG